MLPRGERALLVWITWVSGMKCWRLERPPGDFDQFALPNDRVVRCPCVVARVR